MILTRIRAVVYRLQGYGTPGPEDGHGDTKTLLVVNTRRWPRIVSAVVIGCALAIAGLIFQGIVRNPLVSPDIIGIGIAAVVIAGSPTCWSSSRASWFARRCLDHWLDLRQRMGMLSLP